MAVQLQQILHALDQINASNRALQVEEVIMPAIACLRQLIGPEPPSVVVRQGCENLQYLARLIASDSEKWEGCVARLRTCAKSLRLLLQVQSMGR